MKDLDLSYINEAGYSYNVNFWGHRSSSKKTCVIVFDKQSKSNPSEFEHVGLMLSDEKRFQLIEYLLNLGNE